MCDACAELIKLLIDPAWQVPIPAYTRKLVNQLGNVPVDMFLADVDDLKELNAATMHQPRSDALIRPALQVRSSDALVIGKGDMGDQVLFVFPAGDGLGAIRRIQAELRAAPLTSQERARLILGRQKKHSRPDVSDHLSMTFAGFLAVPARSVARLAAVADWALFCAKGRGMRDRLITIGL